MRLVSALFLASFLLSAPAWADRYEFDKSHTTIGFSINHLGLSDMIGKFIFYDGYFTFDEKNPQASTIDVTIKPDGIRTSSEVLDKELQNEKFFNSAAYPEIRFVSKAIKITGDRTGEVLGDVTMLGITKPVTLHVTFNKADYHPYTQNYVAGFSAEAVIKRSEFGMTNGIPMVGDEVKISIQTEGINVDRKKQDEVKTP